MALITPSRSLAIGQCRRAFSTTVPRTVSLQWDKNDPQALAEVFPPYPYGEPQWYKQQRLGLYGGSKIEFGNNKADKYTKKTRRVWRPNIFTRKLFSQSLNRTVQVRVSTRVLRTIDKLGGLDEYLLGEKETRIKELGQSGWWLRWAIMQTETIKKRFAQERKALGVPETIESLDEPEEDAEALDATELESLSTDDAFVVEQPAGLPPIKFRVGPRQHIVLTENGWKRVRPNGVYRERVRKEEIAGTKFPKYVEQRVAAFQADVATRLHDFDFENAIEEESGLGSRDEGAHESAILRKASAVADYKNLLAAATQDTVKGARREFRKELEVLVDQAYATEARRKKASIRKHVVSKRERVKVRRHREARMAHLASPPSSRDKAARAQGAPEIASEAATPDQVITA